MKTRILLLTYLLLTSMAGFAVTVTISTTGGNTLSPMNVVINPEDIVQFNIGATHNVVEVNQETYQTNGSTPLGGGFQFGFGPGVETVSGLSQGVHYYICQAHILMGMKGTITVTPSMGTNDYQLAKSFSVFPNPATDFINIKTSDNSYGFPYSLIDQGGRQVFEGKIEDLSTTINLSQITSGIYFLQLGEEKRQTFKIIKW